MNRHPLREWSRRVHADDTIICLGDVAHPDARRDGQAGAGRPELPWSSATNDHENRGLHDASFETMCVAALYASDPPLALRTVIDIKFSTSSG